MDLGDSIKRHRKRLKISRETLAFRTKISEKTLYNYEANKRSPSAQQLERIAKALKVSASDLLNENFSIKVELGEDEIVHQILSLRTRKEIRASGILRIISKVLQRLPLEEK